MQQQLAADGLVPVYIGDVLDVGLADHVLIRRRRHHHHPQVATCRAKVTRFLGSFKFSGS